MKMNVLLLSYQSSADDPEIGKHGPAEHGNYFALDKAWPAWREDFGSASLLWSPDDDADPYQRLDDLIYFHPEINTVVAFGREVAYVAGLPRKSEFWSWYRAAVNGRLITVVVIPDPTPRNRLINDESFIPRLRTTFARCKEST